MTNPASLRGGRLAALDIRQFNTRLLALVVGAAAVVVGCASGSTSSFTSVAAADAQARAWVDTAVAGAFPADLPRHANSPGTQSCTSSAEFSEIPYEVVVDVPEADVDTYTAAVWEGFQTNGFVPGGSAASTVPAAPGPGSPSWSLTFGNDGFQVEIVGNRVAPTYVRARIVTPCLKDP